MCIRDRYITLPSLTEIDLENTDDLKLSGFNESQMTIRNEGRGDIKAYADITDLTVKLNGRNELDIRGKGKKLKAYLDNEAVLDGERFPLNIANIKADDRSKASLSVSDTLRQTTNGKSRVRVDGEPVIIED